MKRLFGAVRVLGLALATLAIAVGFTAKIAEARLAESLRGFGEQLSALTNLRPHSAPRKLLVNGLELRVMTASTSLDVKGALDRFQSVCHSVGQIDLPATLRQKLGKASGARGLKSAGVIRQDTDREGFLACIDVGEGTDAAWLLSRLRDFGVTKNLRSLGQLRYAQARRNGDTTTLVMFWTEGDAKLAEMFPKAGDAPGGDLWDMPRPSGGRRILSAFEQGMPYGLATYDLGRQAKRSALHGYVSRLREAGWQVKDARNGTLIAEHAGRTVLVLASESRHGRLVISLCDLG